MHVDVDDIGRSVVTATIEREISGKMIDGEVLDKVIHNTLLENPYVTRHLTAEAHPDSELRIIVTTTIKVPLARMKEAMDRFDAKSKP